MRITSLYVTKHEEYRCVSPHVVRVFVVYSLLYLNHENKQQSIEREEEKMRKTRSDCRVGTFEKKHGLPPGTIRNKDGRDTRSDKKIGTIRKEAK